MSKKTEIEQELENAIAAAYLPAEEHWQKWRAEHRDDRRDALDMSGSTEEDRIAADFRTLDILFKIWTKTHPAPEGHFWGIATPSGKPVLMKGVTCLDSDSKAAPVAVGM